MAVGKYRIAVGLWEGCLLPPTLPAAISFSELLNSQNPNTQQQRQCNGVDELSKSEHSLKFPTDPRGDDSAMPSGYIAA